MVSGWRPRAPVHYAGEISLKMVEHACKMGLDGVSKRRDKPCRAGGSPHWIKVKTPVRLR